jgi:hypothetical protein
MRFSDFLLVSDPGDLDFIVGYTEEQNIRISVSDIFGGYIKGSGNAGYVPVFTSNNSIGNSQIFQDGSNIVIGGVNAMGYRLAVGGTIYAFNGAVIETTALGADALRVISEGENIFIIPNDLGQSITSSRRIIHPNAILATESATLGQLNAAISNLDAEIDILLALKVDKTSVGVANGVASLDAGGKVPLSQIPDSIIGQVQYMGTWNALTNTPTLNFLVPEEKGHYYVVSVAGVFGGIDFQVGDWIISNGTYWEKVDNTDAVTSVFGRIGAILALEADYQAFYPRLSQAYDNPTWINSLAFSKITGVPPFLLENQTITLSGDVTGSGKTSISTTISNNAVSNEKLRDSVGTSVIGRSVFSTGDPADIQANSDGHVLLRSAGNLLFGLISSDSISSINWSKITGTPTTLSGYGITDAYTKTESDNKFVPYTGASANVNLGSNNINANSFIKVGGTSSQFLKADGSVDASQYVPTTRSINAGTGLTGGGNLSSDVNISFDTTWGDTRYAYRTRQLTINGTTYDLSADRTWNVGTVTSVGLSMPSAFTVSNSPVNGSGTLTVVGAGTTADYIRGDGSLAAFPSLTGYVPYTGATQNLDLGTYGLIGDFVRFNPSSSNIPSAEGVMSWDNTDGTVRLSVKGNTYSVPIGQSVISRVRNNTGTNLLRTNYQVVKVAGAQGQRLAVTLAQANNDANSASTLGLVCENISNNQEGFIVNIGQIVNVNTTGNLQGETWLDGDVLYLSPTIAGAITKVKPLAPQHTVIIGYVEYAHANNGKIYVKIDNGYELEELHDVSAEPFINNGLLYRDTTLNLWKSATISTILGYTPAPQGNYITALTGEVTATGPGSVSATLSNSAVTGKVLTGLNVAGNAILSTDSILTAFGKLQHQVNQLVGGLQYEGTWNASTNTPTITSSVGTDGTFYIVNVAGTTNINGITDWQVGDWIVFHDTAWQKVDNTETVTSVFGRVGNIVANQSDYSAFYPLIADIKNGVLTVQGTGVLSGSGTFSANQATNNTITLTHSAVSRTNTTSSQTPSFGGSFNVVDSVTSSTEGHITAIDTKTVTIPSTVATSTQTGLLSNADWITFNGKQNVITLTTTGTSGAATLVGSTLNIPNYAPDLSGYVTLATDQTITGLKTIVRGGDVLNFKIGTDTLYGLRVAYNQNELVPSGEATWSFVNTFNRNGSGFETTPISFFRGVLVTGERLLSASINANLLDYYGNNPSGRYPVYAYNTGVQQFSTGIIVGKTTGVVNAATGAISDLPSGVVANFNGRVIGSNAVNSNEFVALGQLGSYVPTSRTLTINGVTFDLSANRSWTITSGVSSVTASSPLFSSGGSTPNITIQQATASQNGFLSSSDWNTFNNKANANGSNASGTWGISITGNAETVDGFSASQSNVANNIVVRDSSGYIFGSYINMTDDGNPGAGTTITSFITKQSDNYYRSASPANASNSIRANASGTWPISITGNAVTATNLSNSWTNWNSVGGIGSVVGMLAWKNYGNNHVIFDASQSTSPSGSGVNSSNPDVAWSSSYPTLMGWNGGSTYGVRVDSARNSDTVGSFTADAFYRNLGFGSGFPSWDLNTVPENRSGFTYSNNAPYTGPFIHIGASGYGLQFNAPYGGGTGLAFRTKNGDNGTWNAYRYPAVYNVNANGGGDLYATAYYDQSDTSFYLDANSYSRLSRVGVGGGANDVSGININGDGAITGGNSLYFGHTNGSLGSWQTRTFASSGRQIWNTNGFEVNRDGYGGGWTFSINSSGNTTASVDMRSPIFYDSNNTAFYLDPAGDSGVRAGYLNGNLWINPRSESYGEGVTFNMPNQGTWGGLRWYRNGPSGSFAGNWAFGYFGNESNNDIGFHNGTNGWRLDHSFNMTSVGSVRSPIFFDSNDTGFYLDPNSTSNLNQISAATSARWGRSGTYWTVRPNKNSSSLYWTGTNGWGTEEGTWANAWKGGFSGWDIWGTGTDHPQGGGYIHAQGIVSGLHYASGDGGDAYGWMMVGATSATANRYWLRGKWGTSTSGWVEMITTGNVGSQTSGNTNSISSATGGAYTWTATNYFQSNLGSYSGALSSPPLQAYATGSNSAFMSFHRGGNYAVNMGLDADNVLRIGGWSAAADRWVLDMSGNNWVAGSSRAPIFYDSANTGYYVDPASTSVLHTLLNIGGWLEVRSNVASTNPTTESGLFFGWNKSGGNGEANIIVDGGANTGQFLFQRYNGGGSYTNIFQADIFGLTANSGTVSVFSDIRLKTNITNASPKLNDLMKLNVVNYEFVGEYNVLGKQLGFIAQEVEQIFPSLVREQDTRQYDDQGNYINGYQDTKILKVGMEFAMLVKAMQEQQSIIDSLKSEIETLKQK